MPTAPRCLPSRCFEGQLRVESPFEIASPLPKGFDDDEGRHLFGRHVDRQRARWSVTPSLAISLARSRTYSSVSIGTPTTFTPPSGIDAFEERNLLRRRGVTL